MAFETAENGASNAAQGPFEAQVVAVMHELREAMLGIIAGLPGATTRAVDLEKALGVSRTLGWQIHRLVTNPSPLGAGAHVPGAAAVGQVMRAARSAGVAEDRVRRVGEAMRAFESLVKRHAGDRAAFVTMIGSLAGLEAGAFDLKTRRQAFRLNSQVWGVQVKTFLACGAMRPGSDPSLYDMAVVRGLREARRLRAGVPLQVSGQRIVDRAKRPTVPVALEANASPDAAQGPSLLGEFCSRPLPDLESRIEDGWLHTFLRESTLGNAGARTIYLADLTRGIEWKTGEGTDDHQIRSATVRKPTEVLVLDTLIYRGMFGPLRPVAKLYGSLGRLGETDPYAFRPDETLPMKPEVHHLGVGLGALATPHVPRYREMVESVLAGAGWDPDGFEVFRCLVEYPPLGSMVQVRFELPERGNW